MPTKPPKPPGTPTVDLTDQGDFGTINDAVFAVGQTQSAGTGVFNSFVQIQHNGTEQGYNSDHSGQFDEKNSAPHNHSLLLASVPIVIGDGSNGTQEGVAYREFLLDLNESSGGYLSLDSLQLWQEESGNLNNFTPGAGFAGAHTNYLAYNLDAGGDHWVALTDGLSHGSGQSDFRILIRDDAFINDAAHRYVTVYSKFGVQAGWGSDGGFEEWGLHGASGGSVSAIAFTKNATVPGDTANVAGEVITYTFRLDNVGNTNQTGVTVTDPFVTDLTRNPDIVGNNDNVLNVGEVWSYTGHHAVTQAELDTNGGGDGTIDNTATADTAQVTPISATASIQVVATPTFELTKTPDVTFVDGAGDVINYVILVKNIGNTTLTNPVVTDPQFSDVTPVLDPDAPILGPEQLTPVLDGDYNVGDIGTIAHPEFAHNGIQDPGETFVFVNSGDLNQNGVIDDGETAVFTNVGDTNQNGVRDDGEPWQFYNAGDTNHNGFEDDGETFQFNVSHQLAGVTAGGFNVGDTNQDGAINTGETWQYTVSYTTTQADIDNGGVFVVDPDLLPLTHDNTATVTTDQASGEVSAAVTIVQNPHLLFTKTASIPDADHDGKIDSPADDITYTITVANDGNMSLTGVSTSDSVLGTLTSHTDTGTGTHGDNILDVGETWTYTVVYDTQQSDIDNRGNVDGTADDKIHNTASVTTAQTASGSASADVLIDYRPHLLFTKTASIPDADHDGKIDSPADDITYTITVANDGNVTLTGVNASDSILGALTTHTETGGNPLTNGNNILDVGETWTYTAVYNTQQADIDNHGNVDGTADDNFHNTANVTTTQGAGGSASADVAIDYNPSVTLVKDGTWNDANDNGSADTGETISYTFTVTNTGNVTLHNIGVTDTNDVNVTGSPIPSLAPGASDNTSWSGSYTINSTDVSNGFHDNTATVVADEASASSGNDHVLLPPPAAGISIDDNSSLSQLVDPGGDGPSVGDLIQFFFQITNLGNTTLTGVAVSDTLGDVATPGNLQTPIPTSLAGNATFGDTFNHHITAADLGAHHVIDDITVTALDQASALQTATWHYDFVL